MALLDIVDAIDIELLGLFVLGTFAIALIFSGGGGSSGGARALGYATLKKPVWAPPAWLFAVVWTILYTLTGIAAYLVRVIGGPWIEDVNRRSLVLYTILQVVLAMYWIFAVRRWYWWATFIVAASLILAIIVAVQFNAQSTTATVFMSLEAVWLLYALFLQGTIAVRNSGHAVRNLARGQSVAEEQQRTRKRDLQRKTGFSDGLKA